MEEYTNIENKFTDFILELLGPNQETNKQRETKFLNIKQAIEKAFENDENISPQIFCFGSFPLKTYLNESDLDLTIIFEDKLTKKIICNNSYEFLNR
jgi:DNA polymerase sigma